MVASENKTTANGNNAEDRPERGRKKENEMAKVNLCGVQPMDFETSKGDQIKGIKIHLSYQDENVMGYACDNKFMSDEACKNLGITIDSLEPLIGQVVELETNLKGKIIGFHAVKSAK